MWINCGMSQFHLPMGKPDVLRGTTGLVMPDRAKLAGAAHPGEKALDGTKFDFRESNDGVETVCPWGNRIHLHSRTQAASAASAWHALCPLRRPARHRGAHRALLPRRAGSAGGGHEERRRPRRPRPGRREAVFYFRETDAPQPDYDGHHVQVYLTNFSRPYRKLLDLGLITIEDNDYQYRFRDVIDLDTKEVLFTVEHETRSATNPMYGRPLVNRNPAATNMDYKPGHDGMAWALP